MWAERRGGPRLPGGGRGCPRAVKRKAERHTEPRSEELVSLAEDVTFQHGGQGFRQSRGTRPWARREHDWEPEAASELMRQQAAPCSVQVPGDETYGEEGRPRTKNVWGVKSAAIA